MQTFKEYCHQRLKDNQSKKQSHLSKTGRKYTFCDKYPFEIYEFNDYDLDDEFKDFSDSGLYCFTSEVLYADVELNKGLYTKANRVHSLFYLGQTGDFSTRHFSSHEHFETFKSLPISKNKKYIGIYVCSQEQDPKVIESEILAKYNFEDNTAENTNNDSLPTTIMENQVISSTPEQ